MEGALRKLIHLKFGSVPTWTDERLSRATDAPLEAWVSQILSAESLQALLGAGD